MHWFQSKTISEAVELASKPLADRESALWAASDQYMNGEITLEDLQNIEQPYLALEYARCMGSSTETESQSSSFLSSLFRPFKSH